MKEPSPAPESRPPAETHTASDELSRMADALATGERTLRTPRRVLEAFAPPPAEALGLALGPLTMEGWLLLLDAESHYVGGERPRDLNAELRQFQRAVEILTGASVEEVQVRVLASSELEILRSMAAIQERISAAFSTLLEMQPPPGPERNARTRPSRDGGLGQWALLFVALMQELGMTRAEARQTPVAEAGVLVAAWMFREGWDVKGTNWREEEILGSGWRKVEIGEEDAGDE